MFSIFMAKIQVVLLYNVPKLLSSRRKKYLHHQVKCQSFVIYENETG